MCQIFQRESVRKQFNFTGCQLSQEWISIAQDSQVVLCPRGYGRNTLRFGEMMRMGLLPVVVYDDVPFVPYPDLFHQIGWTARLKDLPGLVDNLLSMSESQFVARREKLVQLRSTHFEKEGMVHQIRLFFNGRGDLRCVKLPSNSLSSYSTYSPSMRRRDQFARTLSLALVFAAKPVVWPEVRI